MQQQRSSLARLVVAAVLGIAMAVGGTAPAWSSDHFDSPAMTANPQADIADIYAWTTPAEHRLNLVMTVVGHSFSDRLRYGFHIDSGKAFGRTTASTTITCSFPEPKLADCRLGTVDSVRGDASKTDGIAGRHHRFRVFAGLRDDPFYNNIKGSMGAYGAAAAAVKTGATAVDGAGCALLDPATVREVAEQWRHTDGGPGTNLLANWTASAIVISVDLVVVSRGGPILAVWGVTSTSNRVLDRMARPFVANTLLGDAPFSADEPSGAEREAFNSVGKAGEPHYAALIEKSLAFQDSLDGKCGNQLLADKASASPARYQALARMFADDRLWVNSAAPVCDQLFAVELAALARLDAYGRDCGGRSPVLDMPNMWRSLLVTGTTQDTPWDGLRGDEHPPSAAVFPFLAPPDPHGVDH
ncbi:hypothetical protein [Rhizorhabdus argentea]|uniref:hypothetical protein n=1 Tax=Rhizorhabdus argentea TaxID=1387174 RepID=UPI0030EE7704